MRLSELFFRVGVARHNRLVRLSRGSSSRNRKSRSVGPVNVGGVVRIPNRIRKKCEGAKK